MRKWWTGDPRVLASLEEVGAAPAGPSGVRLGVRQNDGVARPVPEMTAMPVGWRAAVKAM